MAKNSLPKTARVTVAGIELTITQNGRIIRGLGSKKAADALVDRIEDVYSDGGMLFVSLPILAKAFGLDAP
jgi:hypothetical protein